MNNDSFELLEVIGSGGFGTVHRAHQPAFSRDVAVKVLSTRLTDQSARSRFDRECRALGLLSGHPNIVNVFGAGISEDDRPYLVMEYLPGGTLDDRLRERGRMGWKEAAEIGAKLASALQTAHQRGVLHRDLKPSNVLLSEWGEPKLADFGIARIAGEQLTQSQAVTASLLYAAPEILRGDTPTEAADVYALATTVHTLMAGRAAFSGTTDESPLAIISRVGMQDPPDLREHGVPPRVADVIARAMSKQPEERFTTAMAFGSALVDAADIASDRVAAPVIPDDQTTRFAPPSATDPIPLVDGDATTIAGTPAAATGTGTPPPPAAGATTPSPPVGTGPVPAAATGSVPGHPPVDHAPAAAGPGAAAAAASASASAQGPAWTTAPQPVPGGDGSWQGPATAQPPGGGQNRGLVVAVTALAVLVVAGLGFVLLGGDDDDPAVAVDDEEPTDDATEDDPPTTEETDEPIEDPTAEQTEDPAPDPTTTEAETAEPEPESGPPAVEDPQALLEASLLTDADTPAGYAFDGRDASDEPGPGFGETFCNVSDPRNDGTASLADSDVSFSNAERGSAILQDVAVFEDEDVAAAYYDAVIEAAATCQSFTVEGEPPFDWTFTAGPQSAGFGDQDNLWFADLASQGIEFDSRLFFIREGPVVSTMIAFGLDETFDDEDASAVFATGTLKINQAVQAAGL